jgi:5'(3')-deoxyribonucleotidase
MTKEVIALDIDDVAVKHVEGFIKWSNETWGTNLTTEEYSEAWHELWDIEPEEVEARKKLFFTDEIVGGFEVIEGASEGITALASLKKVIGVTSRRESLRLVTEQALEIIAPGAVDEVIFATYFKDGQKFTRSKGEICPGIGATHLIDDQLKHCLAVGEVGVNSILFGDYPWNKTSDELPNGIVRARSWQEVLTRLEGNLDPALP